MKIFFGFFVLAIFLATCCAMPAEPANENPSSSGDMQASASYGFGYYGGYPYYGSYPYYGYGGHYGYPGYYGYRGYGYPYYRGYPSYYSYYR
ncbi:spore coat protein YeeK [Halyomorpha halys]|uniref:spore coat protein YeeK n=1 Tax=Halyomorpha halys TaxID=286706 RepID=UPI0006D4D8DA|nr:prisilkin-39-like [Halyomorpha halys]